MTGSELHTHPNDCPDRKDAALDRKQHAAVMLQRQEHRQALAHAEWFDWQPSFRTPRAIAPHNFRAPLAL